MNTKNIFIILAAVFILGAVAVWLAGFKESKQAEESLEREQTSRPAPPPAGVPAPTTYNLSGTLLAIRGDMVTFGANVERTADGRQLVEEKVARISLTTQIVRFQTVTNPETGRPRVEERAMALTDLRPGDRIQVISNRDILQQEEIQATKIRFLGRE